MQLIEPRKKKIRKNHGIEFEKKIHQNFAMFSISELLVFIFQIKVKKESNNNMLIQFIENNCDSIASRICILNWSWNQAVSGVKGVGVGVLWLLTIQMVDIQMVDIQISPLSETTS